MNGEPAVDIFEIMRSAGYSVSYKTTVIMHQLDKVHEARTPHELRREVTWLHRLAEAWVSQLYAEARR